MNNETTTDELGEGYKIIHYQASNFMRLGLVEINPEDNTIILEGKNKSGKTSILRSIKGLLGGKREMPDKPIKEGEKASKIDVTISNGDKTFYIEKTLRKGKAEKLKVMREDKSEIKRSQQFLDSLVDKGLGYDPSLFISMPKSKKVELLKKVAGLDFTAIDKELESLRGGLHEVGKQRDYAEGGLREYNDLPENFEAKECRAVEVISKEISTLEDARKEILEIERSKKSARERVASLEEAIIKTANQLKELKEQKEEADKNLEKMEKISSEAFDDEKVSALRAELEETASNAANLERLKQKKKLKEKYDNLTEEYEGFRADIKDLKDKKDEMLEKAELPITGLSFDDEGVLFNGLPFEQASKAEQIRVSIAIAIKQNPRMRFIVLPDGALLDKENIELCKKLAKEYNFQLWIEDASDEKSDENAIWVEEGFIK